MKSLFYWYQVMTKPAPMNEFDDYDDYWRKRVHSNKVSPFLPRYKIIADIIPDGASVLDIGCGNGDFIRYLHSVKPQCQIVGADISTTSVEQIKGQGFKGQVILPSTPLSEQFDRQFDYVVMMEVIEHVQDAEGLTRHAAKLARKRLFLTLPNVGFIVHRLRLALFGRFPVTNICCHIKEHIRFWTVTDFAEWANHLGLTLHKVIPQIGGK